MGGLISGVIPLLLALVIFGGFALASKCCKSGVGRFFAGIAFSIGILFVLCGIAFAGCAILMTTGGGLR